MPSVKQTGKKPLVANRRQYDRDYRASPKKYAKSLRWLHWIIALAVFGLIALGFLFDEVPKEYKRDAYNLHKAVGLTVLGLMVLRLLTRLRTETPPSPRAIPGWQQQAAKLTHYALYLTLFIMPISGYLMSTFGGHPVFWFGIEVPALVAENKAYGKLAHDTHEITAYVLSGLITLHILAALKHVLLDKIPLLQRIT